MYCKYTKESYFTCKKWQNCLVPWPSPFFESKSLGPKDFISKSINNQTASNDSQYANRIADHFASPTNRWPFSFSILHFQMQLQFKLFWKLKLTYLNGKNICWNNVRLKKSLKSKVWKQTDYWPKYQNYFNQIIWKNASRMWKFSIFEQTFNLRI